MRAFSILLLAVLLMGAAPPNSQLVRLQEEDRRIATLAWRLQTANASLCPNKGPIAGFSIHDLGQYVPEARDEAWQVFGFGALPRILALVPGSAAARSGLREGDELVAIGGVAIPAESRLPNRANIGRVNAVETLIAKAMAQPMVDLRIRRDQKDKAVRFAPDRGCASKIELVPGGKLNASADGQSVQLSTGIVNFAGSDDAVATVLAHELAHNILGHQARIKAKRMKTRETELEADYWSMYLVIRAGFDGAKALDLWQRYEARTNLGILSDGTHPSKKARIGIVTQALNEIREKQREGVELVPNQMVFNAQR